MSIAAVFRINHFARQTPWYGLGEAVISGNTVASRRLHRKAFDQSQQKGHKEMTNVITQRHGTIVTIGINRPEARNAVNPETASQLVQAFNQFENDPDLTVAVIHGIGGHFCAGLDLKEIAHNASALNVEREVTKGKGPMGPSRMEFIKPVIAAVSGYAVAGGMELSLLADMRVVERSAIFGIFCRRFGVPLIDGGTVRLPKLIGLSRALDLILTGRPVNSQEAYEFGLANRVVPDGQGEHILILNKDGYTSCMMESSSHYSDSYKGTPVVDGVAGSYHYDFWGTCISSETYPLSYAAMMFCYFCSVTVQPCRVYSVLAL